jgi:hypothetical protein
VEVEAEGVAQWPHVIGCGAWPLFVVSGAAIDVWQSSGIDVQPAGKLLLDCKSSKSDGSACGPQYYWIDGEQLLDAELDFEASGYVGAKACPECGRRYYDIAATYARQHQSSWSYAIRWGTWGGRHLFTTNLSPATFFCTDRLVQIVLGRSWENFLFVPVGRAS